MSPMSRRRSKGQRRPRPPRPANVGTTRTWSKNGASAASLLHLMTLRLNAMIIKRSNQIIHRSGGRTILGPIELWRGLACTFWVDLRYVQRSSAGDARVPGCVAPPRQRSGVPGTRGRKPLADDRHMGPDLQAIRWPKAFVGTTARRGVARCQSRRTRSPRAGRHPQRAAQKEADK